VVEEGSGGSGGGGVGGGGCNYNDVGFAQAGLRDLVSNTIKNRGGDWVVEEVLHIVEGGGQGKTLSRLVS